MLNYPSPQEIAEAGAWSGAILRYDSMIRSAKSGDVGDELRLERHRAWVACATASILRTADPQTICRSWSDTADVLLKKSFDRHFKSGAALFALGKLGSRELNLSSDVDIVIVLRDEDPSAPQSLRQFQKEVAEVTPLGFVFRTDFDLRPGGRMGTLLPTVDQFVDYYGNYGETWERMAFVRLRALAGDSSIIEDIETFAHKFSFRKHLDYGLLNDFKSIRAKIHSSRHTGEGMLHLKLDRGGIRDSELFVHALQVIYGGKDPTLRVYGTPDALDLLAQKKLLQIEDAEFLKAHYWRLRGLENFTQARADEQTHMLHLDDPRPEAFNPEVDRILQDKTAASRLVAELLGDPPKPEPIAWDEQDPAVQTVVDEIMAIPLLSRNKEHDSDLRRLFVESFVRKVIQIGGSVTVGLDQLKDFLRATRAKNNFLEMILRQESLLEQIVRLFSYSRYLGRLLCFRPELLDSFVFRVQDLDVELEALLENLVEKRLLTEIIEGSDFLEDRDVSRLNQTLTSVADEIVLRLAEALHEDIPADIHVLALGKWGSGELGFQSDLDLLFVTRDAPTEQDHKFVRRMISRLTEPHRGGSIYPVDLRLRPTGKAGPILIAQSDLQEYLSTAAAPWERQAYLRARWLATPLFDVQQSLFYRELNAEDLAELTQIRNRLQSQQKSLHWKHSDGGLLDIELFAQTRALQARRPGTPPGIAPMLRFFGENDLADVYTRLRQIEQLSQLIFSAAGMPWESENNELIQNLAALLSEPSGDSVRALVESLLEQSSQLLERLDPRRTSR